MPIKFINGAPGCGKTYTLTKLFAESLEDSRAYFAFTVSAQEEALQRLISKGVDVTERVSELVNYGKPLVSTIHAFALYLYAKYIAKLDRDERHTNIENLIFKIRQKICKKYDVIYSDNPDAPGNRLFLEFERQRNKLFKEIDYSLISAKSSVPETRVKAIISEYLSKIRNTPWKTDFTGLLEALRDNKIKISDYCREIYIDEFQDLTPLQLSLFDFNSGKTIYVAGDIDQTVYQFLGVDVKQIYKIYEESEKIYLDKVRRVPANLFELAKAVRKLMYWKAHYNPVSINQERGHLIFAFRLEEALETSISLKGSKLLLFFRNKDLKEAFIYLVTVKGLIPRMLGSRKFWSLRKTVEGIYHLQRALQLNGESRTRELLIIAQDYFNLQPPLEEENIEKAILEKIDNIVKNKLGTSFQFIPKLEFANDIVMDTVHEAKGREADVVMIYDYYPKMKYETSIEELDAQAKMLYVALTRTKKYLVIGRLTSKRGRIYNSLFNKFLGF